MGIPFMPVHGIHGSDYEKIRRDFVKLKDPYSGKELFVVPAIIPDICLIHAISADHHGNLLVPGSEAFRLAALSARTTIASVEQIVEEDHLIARRGQAFLSALHVDSVVHLPLGAHPTSCPGMYPIDETHVRLYMEKAREKESFQEYLLRFVLGMEEDEYREKVGKHFLHHALS